MTIKTAITPLTKRRDLLLFASSSLALAACGGGGGGGADARTTDLDYTKKAWFEGKLIDAAGAGISGALVYIPYKGTVYLANTDGEGKYNLQVAISDFAGLSTWIVKFFKEGFLPKFLTFNEPMAGATIYGLRTEEGRLTKLQANEFSSLNFASLFHIGDDKFTGSINSQLQTSSIGSSNKSTVFPWTADLDGKFKSAEVSLKIRGLNGATNTTKGFISLVGADNSTIGNSHILNYNSDSNGGYSDVVFSVALPKTIGVGALSVYHQTGGIPGDIDDVEYTGISVRLVP